MRHIHCLVGQLSLALAMILHGSSLLFSQVSWVQRLDEAQKLAQDAGKFIVVDVTASWCPPCQKMDREVYSSNEFIEFSKSQIYMHVDAEKDAEGVRIARRYEVHVFPTILILDSKEQEIERLIGGRTTRELIRELTDIFHHPEPLKDLLERAKKDNTDFALQYQAGRRCVDRKEFARAISFLKRAKGISSGEGIEDRASVLALLSVACFQDGKYEDSLQAMDELEKLDPGVGQESELRLQRARVLILLKRYDEGAKLISETFRTSRTREDKDRAKRVMAQLPGRYRKVDKEYSQKLDKAKKNLDSGKLSEALSLANQAAELSPLASDIHILLAAIYLRSMGVEAEAERKAQDASLGLNHLRLALKLDPEDLSHYQMARGVMASRYMPSSPSNAEARKSFGRAEICFAEARYRDAAELYRKTMEQDPTFGKAYLHLGDCFFTSGQIEEALKFYREAAAKTPLDPAPHRFMADALFKLGRRDEARQAIMASLLSDPEYPIIWKNLESLAQAEGKELERHTDIIPISFLLLSFEGDNYDEAAFDDVPKETASAWREYVKTKLIWRQEKFRKKFPNETFYHTSFEEECDCLQQLINKWDQMKEQDANLHNSDLDFLHQVSADHYLEAFIFLELYTEEYRNPFERWKQTSTQVAQNYVESYLLGRPQVHSADGYNSSAIEAYNAGVESQRQGEKDEALEFYRKALAQEPRMVSALQNSSSIYMETGDKENARKTLERWVDVQPEAAQPLAMLAHLDAQEGNFKSAIPLLKKAISLEKDEKFRNNYQEMLLRFENLAAPSPGTEVRGDDLSRPASLVLQDASDALWNGKTNDAIEILSTFLRVAQGGLERDQATLMLATAYLQAGEKEEARRYIVQFLEKYPNHPRALEIMEQVKIKRNDKR